ncbi:hypothetical protein [Pararobbsia alpina]|uniref:Uncharacterized protein n=1 Tax=Pararobbsia alpina TaxID=621374 RepID=A0A6S7B2K0_9BURK|nr:hypothetical protein [Pararobbsia alpina]CAB3783433.1 hypothetical protein LMG28138_01639 [Pararobbsia alpina]
MHPLLTSRQQDLDAMPAHQALLSNFGILAKSQAHASLLHSTLRASSNDHAHGKAPANVHSVIARSAASDIDREAERKYGERKTALVRQRAKRGGSRQEDEQLRRMSEARTNGGINRGASEEIGANGEPVTRGGNAGCFTNLHAKVKAAMNGVAGTADDIMAALQSLGKRTSGAARAKAIAAVDASGEGFEERDGIPAHATTAKAVGVVRATVKPTAPAKPTLATIRKSLGKTASLMRSMGLDVSYDSDSVTLTGGDAMRKQSLDKSRIFGTTVGGDAVGQPKRYTAEQIERAASAALAAGKLTGAQANSIATYIAMGSMPPPDLLACLTGESA